jgi:flagellar motor switch protein FliN/FliY
MPTSAQASAPTAETSDFFSRLRSCSRELYALDRRPLVDPSFTFPWNELAEALKEIFGVTCSFNPQPPTWTTKEDVTKRLIAPTIPVALAVTGVEGQILLMMSRTDIERFMGHALKVDAPTLLRQDPQFFDQFSLFFSAQLVACASSLPALQQLSIRLVTPQPNEFAGSLCQDIEVFFENERGLARLVVPPVFLDSWRTLRLGTTPAILPSEYSELEIPICIEGGRTSLTPEEIASLRPGDFLPLDHPFYIPNSQKSRIFLTHHGIPLFRARVQDGNVKILEMPLQHEAFLPSGGTSMATQPPLPEEDPQQPPAPSEETENPPTEEPSTEGQEKEEEPEWEEEEAEEAHPMTEAEAQATSGLTGTLAREPIDIGQLPLTVVVELAELAMSVEKLSSLQPGNLLDLNIRPESGVSLVVSGKVIGRGELLRIGDSVGVRITEIGFTKPRNE